MKEKEEEQKGGETKKINGKQYTFYRSNERSDEKMKGIEGEGEKKEKTRMRKGETFKKTPNK